MNERFLVALAALLATSLLACSAQAADDRPPLALLSYGSTEFGADVFGQDRSGGARLETLWIFDGDFEDMGSPHNQGWVSLDMSDTVGQENRWHKDTIRIRSFTHLGDSTWWCGMYSTCWRQPRGYGNNWIQYLERNFPLSWWSSAGEAVELEFDQRFAMEHDYDYGYVDVSVGAGGSWTTLQSFTNPGFASKPGNPQDWDSQTYGHWTMDMSAFAGESIRLRFRFESDGRYSCQDQFDNSAHSIKDGAWQLDNFKWSVWDPDSTQVWFDDCESPGDNGWVHDYLHPQGQTGIVFFRGLHKTHFETGRPFTCEDREGWMYAAVDPFSSKMITGQNSWLISPVIDIGGAPKLVGKWDAWLDFPLVSEDVFDLWLASNDLKECVQDPDGFADEEPGAWYTDYGAWVTVFDDWDAFAGNDWFAINWRQYSRLPAAPGTHMAGMFLNRQWVGIPVGDAGIVWNYSLWSRFNDWFVEEMGEALADTAVINIKDDDGIESSYLMASNDAGANWTAYSMFQPNPLSNDWHALPPADLMSGGSEIWYYFEATDSVGVTSVFPQNAPDTYYEFSILPLSATVSNPGILLVDKHGRPVPGEDRLSHLFSESYYAEALGILGYEWEVYDVEAPSGSNWQSGGPDSAGYKYYDTQIWFTSDFKAFTIKPPDQYNLIQWLGQAPQRTRNLLISGNDIGYELMQAGRETLDFYSSWLATNYIADGVGDVTIDSIPTLKNAEGGYDFMTPTDRECILAGGCPVLMDFDVIDPLSVSGAEQALVYELTDHSTRGAGVAYTHSTMDYKAVNLGFGMEYMMDSMYAGAEPTLPGHYYSGIEHRLNLMENIMAYFGKEPTGLPTNVAVTEARNALSHAYPNPFNPLTTISYSVREAGPVRICVHNVAGRVVRTLLDTELEAGASGRVVWDGRDEAGERCSSGVYFYRIQAPAFADTKKMLMLK